MDKPMLHALVYRPICYSRLVTENYVRCSLISSYSAVAHLKGTRMISESSIETYTFDDLSTNYLSLLSVLPHSSKMIP